jgi:hypothetical protein
MLSDLAVRADPSSRDLILREKNTLLKRAAYLQVHAVQVKRDGLTLKEALYSLAEFGDGRV